MKIYLLMLFKIPFFLTCICGHARIVFCDQSFYDKNIEYLDDSEKPLFEIKN